MHLGTVSSLFHNLGRKIDFSQTKFLPTVGKKLLLYVKYSIPYFSVKFT